MYNFWFIISNVGIGSYFLYFHWYLKKDVIVLSLVPALKQKFKELINGKSQTNGDRFEQHRTALTIDNLLVLFYGLLVPVEIPLE